MNFATSFIVIILLHFSPVSGVAIDNGVVGSPVIECSTQSISIKVTTQKLFYGRIFVKGKSRAPQCVQDFSKTPSSSTSIEMIIPLGSCDMQRERKLNPSGLQEAITVIVSFHALFITKVDRAYSLRCFFMTSGEKVITQEYQVSMLTTQELAKVASVMPSCEYTVRRASLTGTLVQYATVGEKLYHVWKCTGSNTFGILVRNCVVQDSSRTQFVAIDTQGCTTDKNVVNDLTYGVNLDEAFVEVHAFKFADDVNVYFKCEITFCRKIPTGPSGDETTCRGVTPPVCNGRFAAPPSPQPPPPPYASTQLSPTSSYRPPYKHQKSKRNKAGNSRFESSWQKYDESELTKDETRVMDIAPKNDFVILDPVDVAPKVNDKLQRTPLEFEQNFDHRNFGQRNETTRSVRRQTMNEQWTLIAIGFAIMISLVILGFIMVAVLVFFLCKRPNSQVICDQYDMSPNSTLRRILNRY